VVTGRTREPHQLPGVAGSFLCHEGVYQGPGECSCPPTHGQQDGSVLCQPNGLEAIRHRQVAAGISAETSKLLAAGWSSGTNTAYQSAWKRWNSWYSQQQVNPLPCPIQPFLEFLTGLYEEGLKYHSIDTLRSAISMTHDQIEEIPIGQHPHAFQRNSY